VRGAGLFEAAAHRRRQHRFLGVTVEAHVGDHARGKRVEIGIAALLGIGRDLVGGELRARKLGERFGGAFAHRGLVVEKLDDVLMRALRQRLLLADNERPIIAFIGRLDPQKGLDLIRHAIFYSLANRAQFVLLGESPDHSINEHFWGLKRQFNDVPDCHFP